MPIHITLFPVFKSTCKACLSISVAEYYITLFYRTPAHGSICVFVSETVTKVVRAPDSWFANVALPGIQQTVETVFSSQSTQSS